MNIRGAFYQILNRVTRPVRQRISSFWIAPSRSAGEVVTEDTALTYSAVWRAVSLISETIAGLPWAVNKREFIDGRKVSKPLYTHPAYRLLDIQPNPETDAFTFRQTVTAWALTHGNGYAEIERDYSGRPTALWQIDPTRVTPDRDESGQVVYKVDNGAAAEPSYIKAQDMFHIRGMGFDGLVGYSVISYAARSIGMGLATEQFGADFFANGAQEGGVLQHPNRLGDSAIKHLKESLIEQTSGRKKHSPLILEEGMTWTRSTIPPDDAQFLETRKFNVSEIARWYGVPPHKLMEMEQATFSNIEHQNIEFVTDAIMSWVKRFEIEADIKLISASNNWRIRTKMNLNGLLRGDTAARGEWYTKMFGIGVYAVNDILELEDRNPIGPEGDKRLVQMNLTTLDKVGEVEVVEPVQGVDDEPAGDDDQDATESVIARTILDEAFSRIAARETRRITAAVKKYDGDRRGLEEFLNKFSADHEKYMAKTLKTPVTAFGIDNSAEKYAHQRADMLRVSILSQFDAGQFTDHSPDPSELTNDLLSAVNYADNQ